MELKMEAHATEEQVIGLVSRLERDGHHLTPRALAKIYAIIMDCMPDTRAEGSQKELAELVRERTERDER